MSVQRSPVYHLRARVCEVCEQVDHDTKNCPFTEHETSREESIYYRMRVINPRRLT